VFSRLFSFFALLLFFSAVNSPVQAQALLDGSSSAAPSQVTLPDPLTPEAVHELVARMSDDQVRGLLLDRLDAVAKAEATKQDSKSLITIASEAWEAFTQPLLIAAQRLPVLFVRQAEAFSNFATSFGTAGLFKLLGYLVVALGLGLAAEKLFNLVTRRWMAKLTVSEDSSLWSALNFLFRRFVRELLGLAVFFLVVRTLALTFMSDLQITFAAPFLTYLIWFPRVGAAISRFMMAPGRPDLRLVNVSDRWAGYLHRNIIGLVLLGGFTSFIIGFNGANGVPPGETRIGFWLSAMLFAYVAIIAWHAREGLTEMMRGTDPDRTRIDEFVAIGYPYFAVGVAVVMWLVTDLAIGFDKMELLLAGAQYTTMFWLLLAPVIDTAIRGLVRHLAPPMIGDGEIAEAAYKSAKRSYIRIGRVIAIAIVVLLIAEAWDLDLMDFAAAGVGDRFAANLIEFIMVSAIGYVIYEGVSLWINRRLAKEQTAAGPQSEDAAAGEGGGAGGSRLTTVLPLIRMTALAAIAVIFALVALSSLGIDTTPLLAGAGILGLAIGFGAQKLVTDIVSGVFFLIDDAFRVGEYVDVGGTMGSVEKISIRSMQLRHHRGLVHTIPYGEIQKLTNFSRDWVIMKLKFTVPFDTNPNQVKKIFKKIGAEMMEDPIHKDGFLEPFKSQGVFDFDDVGMVIRGKFMAKPGSQFTIRKEIYNRVKNEFEAAGIAFARREVRVAIPGLEQHEDLSDEDKARITATAAAAESARQQQLPPG